MVNIQMDHMKRINLIACFIIVCTTAIAQQDQYHDKFFEDFSNSVPIYFKNGSTGKGADFTSKSGVDSPTEPNTKILSFKIDPNENAGAGRGPEIISNYFTHFGSYSARLKIPDVRNIQPNVGAVIGYFTYHMDSVPGLSEIDFEWLLADPKIIYIGTWTGPGRNLKRIGRTINLAEGIIYNTIYRENLGGNERPLTGVQNQPESIPSVEGYDASSQFYTYGFDWHHDRIRWWMIHPKTADTVVLWDYRESQEGIPLNHSQYRMNFWHTNNWPVESNPNSIEKPLHPFELEVDWMSYDPNKNW
jgi:hypothetical protein